MARTPITPLPLARTEVVARALPGGGWVLRSPQELRAYPRSLGEHLAYWATAAPDRTFLAERETDPEVTGWRRVSYAAALDAVRRIAGALLDRGLGPERPVAILSDNGIDNGLLQLAAMHVGIPVAPISPAYSLLSSDHAQLRYLLEVTRPGLVYAADGERFRAAFAAVPNIPGAPLEIVVSANPTGDRHLTLFSALLARVTTYLTHPAGSARIR